MNNKPIDNLMLKISEEDVKRDLRNNPTMARLVEEVAFMQSACKQIDLANLRMGPFTATALDKIKICREIILTNFENIPAKKLASIEKYLQKIEVAIQKRLLYCNKVDKYIDKLEATTVSMLKADFIDNDEARYEKMRNKLSEYKEHICTEVENMTRLLPMPESPVSPPVDESPKLV